MTKLHGKIALITGGTTGIGLATARLFHDEGARVIVTGSNPKTLAVAREALSGVAEVLASDAGDPTEIRQLMSLIAQKYGGLDVLFLNAGITRSVPLAEVAEDVIDDLFRINVKGPTLALKYAMPLLRSGAAVVFNGSISAHLGMTGGGVYGASKAALRAIARTAAGELAERGIRVNVVSPGPTDSGIIEKTQPEHQVAAIHAALIARIPQRRLASTAEIARAVLFLASDDSSFMTGEEIIVDGGMTRI